MNANGFLAVDGSRCSNFTARNLHCASLYFFSRRSARLRRQHVRPATRLVVSYVFRRHSGTTRTCSSHNRRHPCSPEACTASPSISAKSVGERAGDTHFANGVFDLFFAPLDQLCAGGTAEERGTNRRRFPLHVHRANDERTPDLGRCFPNHPARERSLQPLLSLPRSRKETNCVKCPISMNSALPGSSKSYFFSSSAHPLTSPLISSSSSKAG